MERIINKLHTGNYSCVVENYDETYTFSQCGVADLLDMVKNKRCFLKEASVADKVVGKAAAALLILGEITEVYTDIISLSALVLLREAGIKTDFGHVVPFILSHDKKEWCPLERLCYNESSVTTILSLIDEFVQKTEEVDMFESIPL